MSMGETFLGRGGVSAITIFVDDLAAARAFYGDALRLPAVFSDDVSSAYGLGGAVLNVLAATAAPELVEPAAVAPAGAGSRALFTISVDDVDAVAAALTARGVRLLNGPVDRPWGVRTACFADPDGHTWELATPI
jgi:catechol 2,3-dioxygenase-like lactoylglutathione lyase family enzyme